ncbi:MAG TPA: preprotein translocase subunit SecG [Candidatus Acidoferrales bacterium]|nr:preprotein translocase subunit SecG [Candidatus Acidoferrales bacterium]
MHVLLTIIHVTACVMLIGIVLLQQGKGADMGAVFGGSSSTVFGSSGAGSFLSRLTTGLAIVFMLTSLGLTYTGVRRVSSTVFDSAPLPEPPPLEAPANPGAAAPGAAAPAPAAAPQAAAPAAPAAEGQAPPAPAPQAAAPQAAQQPAAAPAEQAPATN